MENSTDDDLLIHEDVLIQILVWLPVISLLRFKSVCKSWRALIESSFFIHLHATLTTSSSCSSSNKFGTLIFETLPFFWNRQTSPSRYTKEARISMLTSSRRSGGGEVFEVEDIGIPPLYKTGGPTAWRMVGSCNGLICSKLKRVVSLWNPATRQFRLLPESSLTLEERGWTLDRDLFGFGFDVKTKDYKVVQIRPKILHGKLVEFRVQVYSFSTNSWRWVDLEEEGGGGINFLSAKSGQESSFYMNNTDGLYLNGSFFFKGTYGIQDRRRHWILSFDFTKEIFTHIKLFPGEVDSKSGLILTYFGADKIAFLVESCSESREERREYSVYDIWVLNNNEHDDQEKNEEEESYYWTKLQHTIQISASFDDGIEIVPRAISDDGEFALITTRCCYGNDVQELKLQLFNLVTKEEKPVFVFPTSMELLRADIYKPTLVSVIGGGGGGGGNGNGTTGSSNI